MSRSFPEAVRRVRRHRELGHHTVLITGALDVVIDPLRPLFDEVVCARARHPHGRRRRRGAHGPTRRPFPRPPRRGPGSSSTCAPNVASRPGECVAYADSSSDLPMLDVVGFPVAVNPEPHLASIARKRGWLVEDWSTAAGLPSPARSPWRRSGSAIRRAASRRPDRAARESTGEGPACTTGTSSGSAPPAWPGRCGRAAVLASAR